MAAVAILKKNWHGGGEGVVIFSSLFIYVLMWSWTDLKMSNGDAFIVFVPKTVTSSHIRIRYAALDQLILSFIPKAFPPLIQEWFQII